MTSTLILSSVSKYCKVNKLCFPGANLHPMMYASIPHIVTLQTGKDSSIQEIFALDP